MNAPAGTTAKDLFDAIDPTSPAPAEGYASTPESAHEGPRPDERVRGLAVAAMSDDAGDKMRSDRDATQDADRRQAGSVDVGRGESDSDPRILRADSASVGAVGFFARLWGAIRGLGPADRESDERRVPARRR
jgi:hypothetical protein